MVEPKSINVDKGKIGVPQPTIEREDSIFVVEKRSLDTMRENLFHVNM